MVICNNEKSISGRTSRTDQFLYETNGQLTKLEELGIYASTAKNEIKFDIPSQSIPNKPLKKSNLRKLTLSWNVHSEW